MSCTPISSQTLAEFRRILNAVGRPQSPECLVRGTEPESYYEDAELTQLTGLALDTRLRLSRQGHFPKPNLGAHGPRWHRRDLCTWLIRPPRFLEKHLSKHWTKTYGLGK